MTNVFGTNLTTVAASEIVAGQLACTTDAASLTAETGPLKHGVYMQTAGSSFYVNTNGGSPEVTASNGVLVSANNPLFIPIKDPSKIRIIASESLTMTFIMY